jgi:hypothetical protein
MPQRCIRLWRWIGRWSFVSWTTNSSTIGQWISKPRRSISDQISHRPNRNTNSPQVQKLIPLDTIAQELECE